MTDALNAKPTLGTTIHAITGKWGWFVALGIGKLILGGVASTNLMAANLASVLVIGAAMVLAGIFQIIHAFPARGLRGFLFRQVAGIVYAAAGAIILYDPVLGSLTLSLTAGAFLVAAGFMRLGRFPGETSRGLALDRCRRRSDVLCRCDAGCRLAEHWPVASWRDAGRRPDLPGMGVDHLRAGAQSAPLAAFGPAGDVVSHDDGFDIHAARRDCLARRSHHADATAGTRPEPSLRTMRIRKQAFFSGSPRRSG